MCVWTQNGDGRTDPVFPARCELGEDRSCHVRDGFGRMADQRSMAGPAPTDRQFTKTLDAGSVHCNLTNLDLGLRPKGTGRSQRLVTSVTFRRVARGPSVGPAGGWAAG